MNRFLISVLMIAFSSTTFAVDNTTVVASIEKTNLNAKTGVIPPIVKEAYEYYEVCGCCENDLKCQLKQKCINWKDGKKYDAMTSWKVKWDYGHNRVRESCSADSFTVTVDIRYRLPKWAKPADAPQSLVEKWENYAKNLMAHESGHRDRAVAAAAELTRTVADLAPYRTCSELDRDVNMISRARLKQLEEDQAQYDAVTSHGREQGALFP